MKLTNYYFATLMLFSTIVINGSHNTTSMVLASLSVIPNHIDFNNSSKTNDLNEHQKKIMNSKSLSNTKQINEKFIDHITVATNRNSKKKSKNEKKGSEILMRSQRAYATLTSYQGRIVSKSEAIFFGGPVLNQNYNAEIEFVAPSRFRFSGKDSNGDQIHVVCDGKNTWLYPTWNSSKIEWKLKYHKSKGICNSLFELMGATEGTRLLPGILLKVAPLLPPDKKLLLQAFATKAVLSREEKIDGHLCFRIVCDRKLSQWIFWVDQKSYLLRQVEEYSSTKHMKFRRKGSSGFDAVDRIKSMKVIEKYIIIHINEKIDEKLFVVPDSEKVKSRS